MKIRNILKRKSKKEKHDKEILSLYEQGKVLQVDNGVDNKEHLKEKDNENTGS